MKNEYNKIRKNSKNYHENFDDKSITPESVGASELYLLSWIDAIERLDILLLEARYLQTNIINDLREPALLLALKYEEKYLWGKGWGKSLEEEDPKILAKKWIISYPNRKNNIDTEKVIDKIKENKEGTRDNIKNRLSLLIDKVWHKGSWSQEQRSNYYSLKAIQILKMEILRDKLELSYHALYIARLHQFNAIETFSNKNKNDQRARFMVLRGAILYRASTDYVERIRDYQYQFSKTVDTFVDYTISYNKYRRRDLGVYSDFLRDRTLEIYNEMTHLLDYLKIESNDKQEPLILHNWMHAYTSKSKYYNNTVSDKDVMHITTHYWMPERPDLQPIIAHEIAHKFIKKKFGDISHGKISYLNDDFSRLLLRIYAALDDFSDNPFDIIIDPKAITKELSCDFLAVTIKGIKYVYAQFIELLSSDISFFATLTRNGKDIDYDNIKHLSYNTLEQFYENRIWYLRIKITLEWLKKIKIKDSPYSNLDREFILGVDKIADEILELYKSLAITGLQSKKESFWKELTHHLAFIIDDSDEITKDIMKWRSEKADDVFVKKTGKRKNKPKYPRSVARIDIRVRRVLYETQLAMKTKSGRLLYQETDDLDTKFENAYGVHFNFNNSNNDNKQRSTSPLYLHIYDIVWQSSLMRAKDLLFEINNNNKIIARKVHDISPIINAIHFEFSMGRDLFLFALEFSIFDHDSPHDRLRTISHLLDIENNQDKKNKNELYKSINKWNGSNGENIKYLLDAIKKTNRGSKEHREKEGLIGCKIKELFDIFNKNKEIIKKEKTNLIPLHYFLKTKDKNRNKNKVYENSFYRIVLEGFCLNEEKTYQLPMGYIIGNISLSASYAQLRDSTNEKDDLKKVTHNVIRHNEFLNSAENSWKNKGIIGNKENVYRRQLGRYDIMFFNPATSLYRCHLPSFSEKDTHHVYDEKFHSFFTRKEMAIPFVLGRKPWNSDFSTSKILVAVRIKLKQRNYRLNFLYRLRRMCLNEFEYNDDHILENMTKSFNIAKDKNDKNISREDCAFLIDGVEDILLLFMEDKSDECECGNFLYENKKIKNRLDNILKIQNSIYQDFMVDRTRLSFSQNCLKALRVKDSKYRAIIFIRLLEDRYLSPMNNNYLREISELNIKFYKIPGEYDYYADITDLIKDKKNEEVNKIINSLSESKYVDSVNTKILHNEEYKEDS